MNNQEILQRLERTRRLMIYAGMKYGLQNVKTIRLSEQLDALLNEYGELSQGNEKKYVANQQYVK